MIGWLDCAAGASGDMLLGAVVAAGAPLEVLQAAVDAVGVEPVRLSVDDVDRHGIGATKMQVSVAEDAPARDWRALHGLIEAAPLTEPVRSRALDAFARLAAAEGRVHRVPPEDVHFHEVGALDAIADVVGVCAGLHALGVDRLTASRVNLGQGRARSGHGTVPVPAPAVLEVLAEAGAPVWAGDTPYEMCTPTGAALLAAHVAGWGGLPPMVVHRVGVGAGSRDLPELPNVVRLVLGAPEPAATAPEQPAFVLETNVDDLDPRLWPAAIARLLGAGAADAWLTPILMKKGRPAHTLHALCDEGTVDAVRRAIFAETTTIGVRTVAVTKHALHRSLSTVDVEGQQVRVKVASDGGTVVNGSVEYEDVLAAAAALGRPVKAVLADAAAKAHAAGLLP